VLAWSASGDDGGVGRPRLYHVRAAEGPLDSAGFANAPIARDVPATVDAGGVETITLAGVRRGVRYSIAIEAEDSAGNRSAISNVVSTWIGPLAARVGAALAVGEGPSHTPVTLYWQGRGGDSAQRIRLYDVAGRLERTFALGNATEGTIVWDGRSSEGRSLSAGVYFVRLTSGAESARAKFILLR
jgi:hypothetical protein